MLQRIVEHGLAPGCSICRVDIIQDAAADLTEDRNVAAQHRGAARQSFGERQAVTLCEG